MISVMGYGFQGQGHCQEATQYAKLTVKASAPGLPRSPHWMRHTHASHALARGAELTTVRDNLLHASVATTSIYLHSDEVKRARQMDAAFAVR